MALNVWSFIDWFFFIIFGLPVLYVAVFSFAGLFRVRRKTTTSTGKAKMAVFVPAYKEDRVIGEVVKRLLEQDYPKEYYDVVVISDRMKEETNAYLAGLPLKLIRVEFERSTKAGSLNYAMQLLPEEYELAVVVDADNICPPQFLSELNRAYQSGYQVIQAHRTAKNVNTPVALLDAVSEEINNTLFRKGHVNLGLSAALIGSGFAAEYSIFKRFMGQIDAVGEDKELELMCVKHGYKIAYWEDLYILDEKIQRLGDFGNQRRRWIASQIECMRKSLPGLGAAFRAYNWMYAEKILQTVLPPRVMLLAGLVVMSSIVFVVSPVASIKWFGLLGSLVFFLVLAIPGKFLTFKLLKALFFIPGIVIKMFVNLFHLKEASRRFIHTQHGEEQLKSAK